MDYNFLMIKMIKTESFERWLFSLKDRMAQARINARLSRLSEGNFGDMKPLRDGIAELRIDHGAGYRVYFMRRGMVIVVVLAGGDKHTQRADIARAIEIAKEWKE